MPQSLSAVYIHLVFSTKHRYPFLRDDGLRKGVAFISGWNLQNTGVSTYYRRGVEDHVHLLTRFGRTIMQADWVKELKRVSNL
jgi:REP element-mobilizing transposase RayT